MRRRCAAVNLTATNVVASPFAFFVMCAYTVNDRHMTGQQYTDALWTKYVFCITLELMATKRIKPIAGRWKERTVGLSRATATMFEGPGDDWVFVLRGTQETASKSAKSKARRDRK